MKMNEWICTICFILDALINGGLVITTAFLTNETYVKQHVEKGVYGFDKDDSGSSSREELQDGLSENFNFKLHVTPIYLYGFQHEHVMRLILRSILLIRCAAPFRRTINLSLLLLHI